MKTGAAYVRVSTEDQAEYSPDSQIRLIKDYARKNDIAIPDEFIFVDEGISARTANKRPSFMRMIGMAKAKPKPFDCILVYSLSRFARNREDSVVYKRMLRRDLGIEVISTSQDFGSDKTSILIEALLEAMDEYYSIDLAENVKRGMTERASRGEPVSIPAFGYAIQEKQYIVNELTAPVVRMIFADFAAGAGYRDIAAKLNVMGIRTARGNPFENRAVEYILRNPVYIGKIRWNPTGKTHRGGLESGLMIVEGAHEPIIDGDTWERVQKRTGTIRRMYPQYARSVREEDPMLRGLLRCSRCGGTLTRAGKSYQCYRYARGLCDTSHSLTIAKADALVLEAIESTLEGAQFCPNPAGAPFLFPLESDKLRLQREHQKLMRIQEAFENGVDSLDEYRVKKQKIIDRVNVLEKRIQYGPKGGIQETPSSSQAFSQFLGDSAVPTGVKNSLLRTFIEKIVFDRKNNRLDIYYYV